MPPKAPRTITSKPPSAKATVGVRSIEREISDAVSLTTILLL
jgi:hypothetical protein